MKIFLCDAISFYLRDVALELKKRDIDTVYWTGCKREFDSFSKDKQSFPNTIFHNIYDAIKGIPAPNIDENQFEPVGADLAQELLECESVTLTMMGRMDISNMPFNKKKHLYFKYLRYWNGVIKMLKPNAIVFYRTPHIVYNFVLYSLAKHYNIPTIMYNPTSFVDKALLTRDHKQASNDLFKEYERIKEEQHSKEELSDTVRKYFEVLQDPKGDGTPEYLKNWVSDMKKPIRIFPSFGKIIKNIKSQRLLKTGKYYLKTLFTTERQTFNIDADKYINHKGLFNLKKIKKIKDGLKKEYLNLQFDVDLKNKDSREKYVYFPLHLQPECSTSPLAGVFVDQILMIKILSFSVPEGWFVYVKENPIQWDQHKAWMHLFRYKGYYKEIAKLKNVRLISPSVSTYDLISNSQVVATATGTAGWEALSRGRAVLIFGYSWYMYCEGVLRVHDAKTCKEAFQKIIEGYRPNPQKVLNFLIAFDRTATTGKWEKDQDHISSEDFVKNITKSVYKELLNIKENQQYEQLD